MDIQANELVFRPKSEPKKTRSGYWMGKCSGCHQTKELVLETNWCDKCLESKSKEERRRK